MVNTDWDVDKYRNDYESDEHWGLRRQFMTAHKNKFPEFRLVCLTQVFFNMEFLGCKYPEETMALVSQMADDVAKDFRDSRKDKLKRTFVGAQDAAGAKAKGAKPPSGSVEGSTTTQEAEEPATKRSSVQISEGASNKNVFDENIKELAKTFVLMIPTRANSKTEADILTIVNFNFINHNKAFHFEGSKAEGGWTCSFLVNTTPKSSEKPNTKLASVFAPTQRQGKEEAASIVIEKLREHCTVIEPNFQWFQEGKTPEFIRKRQHCSKSPRSYLILTKKETGHITPEVADKLILTFKESSNDDMFFIDEEYNEREKQHLMGRCQHHQLGFRHFGDKTMLKDHHVCISKKKSSAEVLEEARVLGGQHPKYIITRK